MSTRLRTVAYFTALFCAIFTLPSISAAAGETAAGYYDGAAQRIDSATRQLTTDNFVDGTVRLRTRSIDSDYTMKTGWGAAFAVDLSSYGLRSSRYLLTAAHLVISRNHATPHGDLEIEVGNNQWALCKVVGLDRSRDLCLLESSVRLPVLSKLSNYDEIRSVGRVGENVVVVGCPRGVPPCVSRGTLTDRQPPVAGVRWQAAAAFNHGNSGGPVYDEASGKVIGVAVAGMSDGMGEMLPGIALFAPFTEVRSFLEITIATHTIVKGARKK
jgi:S1-C subfamily serine protease